MEPSGLLLTGLILSLSLGTALGWSSGFAFRSRKVGELEAKLISQSDLGDMLREQNDLLTAELDVHRGEIERMSGENASFSEQVRNLEEKLENQDILEESLSMTLKGEISGLVEQLQKVQQSESTAEEEPNSIQEMLTPVTTQFADLQQRMEKFMEEGSKERGSMQEVIQHIGDYTNRLDASADQMVKALKSEHRIYGNWGKTVLARIMELAGLQEGREYRVFAKEADAEQVGLIPPDIVVPLPGERDLLIDSKVSLEHWNRYVNVADDSNREESLSQFAKDIKAKIGTMAEQDYSQLPGIREVDFLFLFIPVEAAWVHLMQEDPAIAAYAQENRIAVVSASNLLLALKLVSSLWNTERKFVNIDKIIERAHLLYKKWQAFAQDLGRVGTALNRMQNEYGKAMDKLTSGRGNLVRQTEELIHLGVNRPPGKLPESIAQGLRNGELYEEEGAPTEGAEAEGGAEEVVAKGKKSKSQGSLKLNPKAAAG